MARPKKQPVDVENINTKMEIIDGKVVYTLCENKDKKIQKTLYLYESTVATLEDIAKKTNRSVSYIIDDAVKILKANMVIKTEKNE